MLSSIFSNVDASVVLALSSLGVSFLLSVAGMMRGLKAARVAS